jgi:imidazolonepropionase-like amidohydrolase
VEGARAWVPSQDYVGTDVEAAPYTELFREMARRGTLLEPAHMADGDFSPNPLQDWQREMRGWACRVTGAAHRAGVVVSAGTDTLARAGALQREMARLVECGLAPLQAIRAATLNNAIALGIEETHGTIARGKVADIIVIAGDPVTDISALNDVMLVMQRGRIVR